MLFFGMNLEWLNIRLKKSTRLSSVFETRLRLVRRRQNRCWPLEKFSNFLAIDTMPVTSIKRPFKKLAARGSFTPNFVGLTFKIHFLKKLSAPVKRQPRLIR